MEVPSHEDNIRIKTRRIAGYGFGTVAMVEDRGLMHTTRRKTERPVWGRSVVADATGYSVLSIVISEEAAPGHSISLGVGVYPVTAGLTTNGSSAL